MLLFRAASGLTWNAFFFPFEALAIQRIHNDFSKNMCSAYAGGRRRWGTQVDTVEVTSLKCVFHVFSRHFWLFVMKRYEFLHLCKMRACMNSSPDDCRLFGSQAIIRRTKKNRPWIRIRLKWKCYHNMLSHFYPSWVFHSYRFILCVPQNILLLYSVCIFAYKMVYLIKIFVQSIHTFQGNFSGFQLDKLHLVRFWWQSQELDEWKYQDIIFRCKYDVLKQENNSRKKFIWRTAQGLENMNCIISLANSI